MVDSRLAFDIMARDDGATAVLAKVERALDKTGNAAKKNTRISEAAAKASATLTKAHNAESDALDKVQVAEARLADVRGNSKSKTSQIIAAEKALSKARRDAAVASNAAQKAAKELGDALDNEGKKAGKSFGSSLKKWLTGSGGLGDAGKAGGTVFGSGFLGVLKTPVLGPAVAAAIAAGVTVALPAVGAIAASSLVAGFGAGLAGLGIVFAAKSEAVKNAWSQTISSMGKDMTLLSKPFESTLISIAGFARRTFATFAPSLQENFKEIAPAVTQFADQLARGLERLQPAVRPLSEAFEAVLASLGPATQAALGSISAGLQNLAESVKKSPDGLADLVEGIGALTNKALGAISVLNDFNGKIEELTGGTSAVDIAFGKANSKIGWFIHSVSATLNPLIGAIDGLDYFAQKSDQATGAIGLTGDANKYFTQGLNQSQVAAILAGKGLDEVGGAAARSAHETHMANVAAYLLATAFDRQSAATQRAIDALNRQSNLLLSLSGSQIAYQQAVDDATAAIKENGKTHDINSQKGRNNQLALDQVAASAVAQRDAMLKANDGNVKAARSAEASRVSFIKLATQMGYTVPQAKAMAQSLIKIPNVTRTAKLQANKADLEAKLASAKKQLADKDLTKERRARLTAEIKKLEAGIAAAKAALSSVPASKTVTITTRLVTERISRTVSGPTGGHVPTEKRAAGGPVTKGQPYWVGEKGPEPFIPDQNGTILPNSAVKKGGSSKVMGLSVAAGLAGGIQSGAASAIAAAGDMAAAVIAKANDVLGISSPSKKFTQIALYIAQGFNRGIRGSTASIQSAMASLMSKVVGLGFSSAKQGRILRMLQMENKGLQSIVNRRIAIGTQLTAAQGKLAAAIQLRDEFKKSITDSALSFNSITNIEPGDGRTHLAARDIIGQMQSTLEQTRQFAANLARLKSLGIRSDLYKQIAEAGVEAGGATATALLQGGKGAVTQVNSIQAQIATAAGNLGNTAANNMYQAGVAAAQGLVNGLLAKTKALDAASKKLADAIVRQIKKTLGIRSPSKVLMWHGSMAGQGFAAGIVGEYGRVRRAGVGLGAAAAPGSLRPVGTVARGGQAGGEQRVVFEFRSDGSPHMDWLMGEVKKYVHINGGGDVQQALGGRPW